MRLKDYNWESIKYIPLLDRTDGAIKSGLWSKDGGWKLEEPPFMKEFKVSSFTKEEFDDLEIHSKTKRMIKNLLEHTKCQKVRYIDNCCSPYFAALVDEVSSKNLNTILKRIEKESLRIKEILKKYSDENMEVDINLTRSFYCINPDDFYKMLNDKDLSRAISEVDLLIKPLNEDLAKRIVDTVFMNMKNINDINDGIVRKRFSSY